MSLVGRRATISAVPTTGAPAFIVGEVVWAGVMRTELRGSGTSRSELYIAVLSDKGGRLELRPAAWAIFEPNRPDDGSFEYAEAEMERWATIAKLRQATPR